MTPGPRWLLTATAGIALLTPCAAHAQARPSSRPRPPASGAPAPASAAPAPTTTAAPRRTTEGSFQAPAPIRSGQPISVLVFPFTAASADIQPGPSTAAPAPGAPAPAPAQPTPPGDQDIPAMVTAAVKAGFLSTPAYSVISYHSNSALVQRAKAGEILKADDTKDLITPEGAVNGERAKYLAYHLGLQTYLVGTVETKTDPKANSAELTVDAQLVNSATGEVIRSAAASGAAAGAAGVPMEAVLERAAQETAQKVLPALGIELVPLQARASTPSAHGKTHKGRTEKPKSEKKSRSDKKAAREAKKAEERAQREAKEAAKKAAEQTRKQQRNQEKLAREASRKAERDAEKARRDAEKARKEQPKAPAASSTGAAVTPQKAPPVQQDVQQAQPPAAAAQRSADTVKGTANAAGQPIPYGYALGENKQVLPTRHRNNIKVPAWLGVASFLTGVSFLL